MCTGTQQAKRLAVVMSMRKEKQTRESKLTNETDQGATRNKTFEFGVSFLLSQHIGLH